MSHFGARQRYDLVASGRPVCLPDAPQAYVIVKLRLATRADIAGMHVVRISVRENRLTSRTLDESDYERAICVDGQGWVIEDAGEIVAFAVGNATDGNLWALFVLPERASWIWQATPRHCRRLAIPAEAGSLVADYKPRHACGRAL